MSGYKFISFLFLTLFIGASYAQENKSEGEPTDTKPKKNIERIEVTGKKPRRFFLNEFQKHQREFVASFNELVDDSEMEVVCDLESHTRTRIKKRNCQPRFMKTLTARETQRDISRAGGNIQEAASLQQASNVEDRRDFQKKLLKEYKKFQKLTAEVLNKNPELAATYIKMEDALAKYQEFDKD
jgi:hypothetical protein